ncbi:MAG: hypothetical protein HPY69_06785 [Armatimonadetes bacterium]|nr:hypothetical protein [Armatimonadota bacterium]
MSFPPQPTSDHPIPIRAHHLLCAVCVRGGCDSPPCGLEALQPLLDAMWADPFQSLLLHADLDIALAHYRDAYTSRDPVALPEGFANRRADYVTRKKDLEVLRVLGLIPNSALPAFIAYRLLFSRQPTLQGICRSATGPSENWPECPHARAGYYERIAAEGEVGDLEVQTRLGEELAGRGLWAMVHPRNRADMAAAKQASARYIREQADRLFIRPAHLLCILCTADQQEPLIQDNLVELRQRMEADPDIPVTLTEGCCMVCDSCNVYDPARHLCYHGHIKAALRDLMVLELLDLAPGATLPAGDLYQRIYDCIGSLKEVCGWRDGSSTAPFWGPCSYDRPVLEQAREMGLLTVRPTRENRGV